MSRSLFGKGQKSRRLLALGVTWILSGAYALPFLERGWIPHDEGLIAQSAERVLAGELPHRDFGDAYTGGLSFLHAAGFRLSGADKAVYESLVALIREKSEGGPIFAGPDCPEVYFLSNLPNQTRALYDFLSPQTSSPLLTRLLAEKQVKLVVINGYPNFSRQVPPSVLSAIRTAYPCSREIGRFSVYWSEVRTSR